jgi:hypothetical protein
MKEKYLELERAFLDNDIVYVNTWSQDCDGVSAVGYQEFTCIEDFYKWEDSCIEWAEGPFGWELTTKDKINQPHTYGGWGDY